ncbi:MAG: LysM peptidoglycan-binding domain-containing protein, partial [Trueperaceae bacterium]
GPREHLVGPGDTLFELALLHGVTVDQLRSWNGLADTVLHPGDRIRLEPIGVARAPSGPAPQAAAPLTVDVKPGDSLWRIARTYDTTPAQIAAANGIAETAVLQPGDALTIPGAVAHDGSGPNIGGFASPVITVSPGDTLWDIARRYDTTVADLINANDLDGASLQAGQELRLVGASGTTEGNAAAAAATDDPTDTVPAAPAPTPITSDAMVWPLQGPITSRFGWRPLRVGGTNMHYGLDIDGHHGDPIVSASTGAVTFAGWMGGFGQLVVIERGDTEFYYAHASEVLVREGQQVAAGDLIARVGATGRVTGPHLHFEVREAGSPIDPLPLLETHAGRR